MEEKNSEKKERKMRDSGIPWIGEVPEGWELVPLKYLLSNEVNSLKVGPFGSQLSGSDFTDDGYWVYNQRSVLDKNFDSNDTFISESKFNSMNSFKVEENDILITTRGTIGKICRIPQNYHKGVIHPCIIKFRINESLLMYSLLEKIFNESDLVKKQFEINSNATTIDVIYGSTLRNILIPVPPVSEQHRIADFLDSKYSEIDTLIENLRARMQSAKEYKKAVITEAVTKGLNKDAKMKDSGVEWIGEIPEGWKVVRFKHVASIKSNLVQPDKYMKYPQIAPDNIEKDTGRLLSHQTVGESGIISGNHLFYRGQILYSKIRPNLNKLTIAPFDGLCSADMYPIEPKLPTLFMVYSMLSAYFVSQVSLIIQDRVKMPKINQEELGEIKVVVPSQQEMLTIADYLNSKCSEIDTLLQNYDEQITVLEEYKKSLIYEYVTGKKNIN